ncbi:alpha-1,6-mannosyl-glycoprotein 2-beta-N-acetylglucosaminyltransferase-like isoform X2 [Contarinia nasturtii]|uniref:alpha-1,6-mannosyl-glycoprotein 2-beta-N-acetylglucosaminyltransferase-like isoform X2 n=1 Tax=Contarinia nasturtii TaxID=265458 RepID=UPI0012D43238|nr:alpha-1,6-mannosyl-glycoprotein 2-beta-N-acetylglucosaminyltransferase-like isoform X2 [Contarinia nasturtii]
MRGRRIPIALPNTGALARKRNSFYLRAFLVICLVLFAVLQLHLINSPDYREQHSINELANDSSAAILQMVPVVYRKFLTMKPRNQTNNNKSLNGTNEGRNHPTVLSHVEEILRNIARYNELQSVLNEDLFGPLANDSVIIVIQVHTRVEYLRHLIVSLAQAKDISKTLVIFSHDYYDENINDLVQTIDFCKVLQIFYPYSIQTHEHEFPGEDPNDCPRNLKRDQAIARKCNNALYPDLYGHYREAKFTQTKHHWWWKANRVFDQLDVTRHHTGLVLFLEEDHYVAEDFLHLLELMQKRANELCARCNILSLGTYLKTFNYYTYANVNKVEVIPWISSKHNMGFAFNRSTWREIVRCANHFCTYDDYNWDWSLQHVSQQCLQKKLHAMVVKGPRVFHIGECGVHHKKKNCESNQVISKVQQVLRIASKSHQLYPKMLTLTVASVVKKSKLRKGNGGWSDVRDHNLCLNVTWASY